MFWVMEEKYPRESRDSLLSPGFFLVLSLIDQSWSPGGPSLSSNSFSSEGPCRLCPSLFTSHSLSLGMKSRNWGQTSWFPADPFISKKEGVYWKQIGWKMTLTLPVCRLEARRFEHLHENAKYSKIINLTYLEKLTRAQNHEDQHPQINKETVILTSEPKTQGYWSVLKTSISQLPKQ